MSQGKTVLLSGGGTGGHITPLLAVAQEIKRIAPNTRVVYVGERGSQFGELTSNHPAIDATHAILTGKFRRYHTEPWTRRMLDFKTIFLNIRDACFVLLGIAQSYWLLGRIKPDVVFLKGGFVGVPIGLAAAARRVPFVTHDSDSVPGLANRLVGRWARLHCVALPVETYAYPRAKTEQVGVLVEADYQYVTPEIQKQSKSELGLPTEDLVLLITGGSSGAQRLNIAVRKIHEELLRDFPKLRIIHQVGRGKTGLYDADVSPRLIELEFMRPMYLYTGAADVVVTRAGANAVAELGTQAKACVIVPSPHLTGGHQLQNAKLWEAQGVAIVVPEDAKTTDASALDVAVRSLLTSPEQRQQLAQRLHEVTLTNAAQKLATILLKQ